MKPAKSLTCVTLVVGSLASLAVSATTLAQSDAAPAQSSQRGDVTRGELLGALLYTDMSVEFDGIEARRAFEFVATSIGVPLVVRYSDDSADGIDPELEVNLNMSGSAIEVLERLLEICSADAQPDDEASCSWQLRDGFIEAGTKSRLKKAKERRMYPVRDLLFEPPMFDNAPKFNLGSALDQGGGGMGGGGGGMGGGGGGGGFGGGGGGGGFGGGGSGGGGGGGGLVGEPGEDPERMTDAEKAELLEGIIKDNCEPASWGDYATLKYYQGVFIVNAPDFVHRQINGYKFAAIRPKSSASTSGAKRYVTFTSDLTIVQNSGFDSSTVKGAAGSTAGAP